MAYATRLIQWALQNAGVLHLNVRNLNWIQGLLPNMIDLSVSIKVDGESYFGLGIGENKDLALQKGLAEAIERSIVREHGFPTSNGFAGHVDWDHAKSSAENELIERDQILCHFYTSEPFARRELSPEIEKSLHKVFQGLKNLNARLSYFALGPKGVLCVIEGGHSSKPFGFILGAARKPTEPESVFSATIEALRQLYFYLSKGEMEPISLGEFMGLENQGFDEHGRLGLDLKYADKIAHLFERGGRIRSDATGITSTRVHSALSELAGCPLIFARADSPWAQDLFTGPPKPEEMNLKRLSEFAGRELTFQELNPLPHPFN